MQKLSKVLLYIAVTVASIHVLSLFVMLIEVAVGAFGTGYGDPGEGGSRVLILGTVSLFFLAWAAKKR